MGVDVSAEAIERARAASDGVEGLRFERATVDALPFEDNSIDVVFAHALFQHLADPARALIEMRRILVPGGMLALRTPDWGGVLVAPHTPDVASALGAFVSAHYATGDAHAGGRVPALMRRAGFEAPRVAVSVEREQPVDFGAFAADRLEGVGDATDAMVFRDWASSTDALFAQLWTEVIARKPDSGA